MKQICNKISDVFYTIAKWFDCREPDIEVAKLRWEFEQIKQSNSAGTQPTLDK